MKRSDFRKTILFLAVCLLGVSAAGLAAGKTSSDDPPDYKAGGVIFSVPSHWPPVTPDSRMRLFQFEVPPPDPVLGTADLSVFYFGPGMGGSVEDNLERWKSEFTVKDPGFPPFADERLVNGMKVTTIQIEGTFQSGMPGGERTPKSGWGVAGAIVEGPEGLVFFKMSGPVHTVRSARILFDLMTGSMKPAPGANPAA